MCVYVCVRACVDILNVGVYVHLSFPAPAWTAEAVLRETEMQAHRQNHTHQHAHILQETRIGTHRGDALPCPSPHTTLRQRHTEAETGKYTHKPVPVLQCPIQTVSIYPVSPIFFLSLSGWLAGSLFRARALSLSLPLSPLSISFSPLSLSLSLSAHAHTHTHTQYSNSNRATGTHLTSSDEAQGLKRERHPHPLDIAPTNVLDSPQRPCTPW